MGETRPGKGLERQVADAFRRMGAKRVEHDLELGGNQIDVYVELETRAHLLQRIAVEAKDWADPVGVETADRQSGRGVEMRLHSTSKASCRDSFYRTS